MCKKSIKSLRTRSNQPCHPSHQLLENRCSLQLEQNRQHEDDAVFSVEPQSAVDNSEASAVSGGVSGGVKRRKRSQCRMAYPLFGCCLWWGFVCSAACFL